ncbi:hypothetical protein [Streptomyces sp. JB150]|uniref:hypothetical protein n=1 Tax=Streptomyces sp. JB150 TaxID=2714844 RepID=UPI001407F729|nr:hypothetical protein [Streptomyces sp. JB150]QIJ61440.1 hypothetical protein G7Z13_04860 [Streptomyces sp. JB150]
MTRRPGINEITSDQLDALYDQLDRLQQDIARQAQEMATWRGTVNALDAGAPGTPRARAERAEAAIERVRALAARLEEFAENALKADDRSLYRAIASNIRTQLDGAAPSPAATEATGPREHCGNLAPAWTAGPRNECVLRPGHFGSHADGHGARWWYDPHTAGPSVRETP